MRSRRWRWGGGPNVFFDLFFFATPGEERDCRNQGQVNDCSSGTGELHPAIAKAIAMPLSRAASLKCAR